MTLSSDQLLPEATRMGRELVLLPPIARSEYRHHLRNFGLAGVCLVTAAVLGWGVGRHLGAASPSAHALERNEKADVAQLVWQSEAAQRQEAHQLADEVRGLKLGLGGLQASLDRGRPADDAKALRASIETLKQGLDTVKSETAGALAQLSGKLDRADQGMAQKLAQIVERLDRLERKGDPMPLGSIAPQPPARPAVAQPQPSGAPPLAKVTVANAQPQRMPIQGWILRDVYNGVALVEGRGGYREVGVGEAIPGIGRVEAIERHGRHWVVVTSQGVIVSELN
jgi:hypothetical protein